VQARHEWDSIAERMIELLDHVVPTGLADGPASA
jgi:hypothetical protein